MDREPQLHDRVSTSEGEGPVVGRTELNGEWFVHVAVEGTGHPWKGFARDVELISAAGEADLRRELDKGLPSAAQASATGPKGKR